MAELHHWMRFWHNTEGKNHIEKSFGLVTSLALSSLWHRQRPVVWMRTLIVFHKVPLPVSRVQGSHQQTETPKLCLLFLVRHNLITWECRASLTSPVLCKTGMFGVFPLPVPTHECSIGFWLLDTLHGRYYWGAAMMKPPLALGTASFNAAEENEHLGMVLLGSHAGPPTCCKYMTSLCKAVSSVAHFPKYALYRCIGCDFNNSQSLFPILCYWLNSKGSIYIKGQILKILRRTLGYLFWNLIEISVMLFTDENPNRCISEACNDSSVLWNETQQGGK